MPVDVLLPKWGMGMNDGMIVKWLKQEGDHVEVGEHLVEIESAKVNSEVESPAAGTLARIVVPEGMVIVPGTVIAVILGPGEEAKNLPPRMEKPAAGAVAATPSPQPSPSGRGVVEVPASAAADAGPRQVTPIARRLAQQLGVNLDAVAGTGPAGRVTEEDVRKAAAQRPAVAGPVPAPAARVQMAGLTVRNATPLKGMRGTIARRMYESGQAPTVTLTHEVDVTAADPLLEKLVRDWRQHRMRPQLQDIILKAVARALSEHPRANSYLIVDPASPFQGEVHEIAEVNVGFAVAVPVGLLVPVIRNADKKSLLEVAQAVRDITARIKGNQLKVDDLEGGTFSVTNLGSFGVDAFNPLLNPPQVGILGLGRPVQKPAVHQGQVVTRSLMWLSLTFDHRAWDGAPAGEFLRAVARYVSDPGWMAA
ncbi:MAG: 2-oxo acid dehydrogenase subunit E2 [Chloroflexi bacterium]|nr:2-oxo acid dehydrogenase subunit E2 [Chloroflexota bacterium]